MLKLLVPVKLFSASIYYIDHLNNTICIYNEFQGDIFMEIGFQFLSLNKWVTRSIGNGKIIVEFFSAEIEFRVCNKQQQTAVIDNVP